MSDDASWAALREDLGKQYATGDVIEGPSELIEIRAHTPAFP